MHGPAVPRAARQPRRSRASAAPRQSAAAASLRMPRHGRNGPAAGRHAQLWHCMRSCSAGAAIIRNSQRAPRLPRLAARGGAAAPAGRCSSCWLQGWLPNFRSQVSHSQVANWPWAVSGPGRPIEGPLPLCCHCGPYDYARAIAN